MITLKRSSNALLGGLGALALLLFCSSAPRAQTNFTSAIDVTGLKLQLHTAAPERDTQKLVDVTLPAGLLAALFGRPKVAALFATPLSMQIDQYWNARDPKSGMTPRQEACDGKPGKDGIKQTVAKEVAKIGSSYSAYDITCDLASTGQLLVRQVGSTMYLAYQLTNNTVSFASTSPDTCHAGHGTPFCPNDPRFTVHFATQIVTELRTPGLCQIVAEQGTVYVVAASIHADNGAADIAKLIKGDKFIGAEVAITNTVRDQPLPIDESLKELRETDACTGKTPGVSHVLSAFRNLDTEINLREGIILRAIHVGITAPSLGVPDPGGPRPPPPTIPSFTHPEISTSQPSVKAGTSVQVSGRNFPPNTNVATALPVTMQHGSYGNSSIPVCFGGWADLEWGPAGRPLSMHRLAGDAQGRCPAHFDATNLTPNTGYQFRVRDCDPITCSPWSATARVITARADVDLGAVVLTLDGGTPVGASTVNAQGTFVATITIPAGTSPGTHALHAVNRDAKANENVQILAPTSAGMGQGSLMMVALLRGETGCPNHPIVSTVVDDTFMLFGSGFAAGTVTIHLDTATGHALGTATVRADGSFCQQMQPVPRAQAGAHTIMALQNGAIGAQLRATFVVDTGGPR